MRRLPAPQEFIGYKKHILLFMDLLSALWYNKRSLCSLPERLSKGVRQAGFEFGNYDSVEPIRGEG